MPLIILILLFIIEAAIQWCQSVLQTISWLTRASNGAAASTNRIGVHELNTVLLIVRTFLTGAAYNDNTDLLSRSVHLVAKLPAGSVFRRRLEGVLFLKLFSQREKALTATVSRIHGDCNGVFQPQFLHMLDHGAANRPYVSSTRQSVSKMESLPDPETLFDTLMARSGNFRPHPGTLSSVFFYFAAIVTHDIFQTASAKFLCICTVETNLLYTSRIPRIKV